MILRIVWDSAKEIGERMLAGIDPAKLTEIENVAAGVEGVDELSDVRARWLGHTIRAEMHVGVDDRLSLREGHDVGERVRRELQRQVAFLGEAVLDVRPIRAAQ